MDEKIEIWLVGNTGLRNPNRIQEGFSVFANSPFVGNLHGRENEIGFMNLLNEKGIIQNENGKDESGSHARKWRLMFAKSGFIYPQIKKKDGDQKEIGTLDAITPFGKSFLQADTYPAVQECYLRAMSVEQFPMADGFHYFSPLRWLLAIMLELEKRTGSSELSRIEFALWGHTTNPGYSLGEVVENILDLRKRRRAASAKRTFDKLEIAKRGEHYEKKNDNFLDYSDMNMRYLRISGVFQRKGRGLIIVPAKHVLAEKLAKSTASEELIIDEYKKLCNGAPLPTDSIEVAKSLLHDLMKQMKERHVIFDISDLPLDTPTEINIARQRLENMLAQTDEIKYANNQCDQWEEISDYMSLLINGGGKLVYDEDNAIEIPKDEMPAYLEWVLWRASLAINHMVNKPYDVRGFKLDADFMPVSTAGGGKGDLYCEFEDFTILIEVTMSTSSRQEAMEGEPVRRHVSDAVLRYNKPVYGMFIAVKIDTNTAETFRHGIWYAKDDEKQRLDIVPLTLAQFQKYFVSMFRSKQAKPEKLRDLIVNCKLRRDYLDAPAWKRYIDCSVIEKSQEILERKKIQKSLDVPFVPVGAAFRHVAWGEGQVVALVANFPDCRKKLINLPYLKSLPAEVIIDSDGKTLHHERFGEGSIIAFIIVFSEVIMTLSYPVAFEDGSLSMM
ncbi:MAG: AlwI family type II restriction endonuclease [Lacrimispora sp.]|uniref:AlwI family type II restriction endonuclease n=1 Tax=Lacrimispora sp. TaxID=2719234 RepID=UPI0039E52287